MPATADREAPSLEDELAPLADLQREALSLAKFGVGSGSRLQAYVSGEAALDLVRAAGYTLTGAGSGRVVVELPRGRVAKLAWHFYGLIDNLAEAGAWFSQWRARPHMATPLYAVTEGILVAEKAEPLNAFLGDGKGEMTHEERRELRDEWLGPINDLRESIGLTPEPEDPHYCRLENYGLIDGRLVILDVTGGPVCGWAFAFRRLRFGTLTFDRDTLARFERKALRMELEPKRKGWGAGPTRGATLAALVARTGFAEETDPCVTCDSGEPFRDCCGRHPFGLLYDD